MLTIRNIHKTFGDHTILRGIDLDIEKGSVVVILGPSGSGKTTFLRCLNALEMPEAGTIAFDGAAPLAIDFSQKPGKKDILALRRKSGMVFQHYNLFPHKTARENIMEGPVIVQPSAASSLMVFSTSCTSSGSSAEVGSSNSISSGRMASARAMPTRCCWPPESW